MMDKLDVAIAILALAGLVAVLTSVAACMGAWVNV